MRKLVFSLILSAIFMIAHSQTNTRIHAVLKGYDANDTIKIGDFLKLTDLALNDKTCSIVNYVLFYSDGGYDYEYVSHSNKILAEMKDGLSKIKNHDGKVKYVVIKDITVQTPENKQVKIDNLVCRVKFD